MQHQIEDDARKHQPIPSKMNVSENLIQSVRPDMLLEKQDSALSIRSLPTRTGSINSESRDQPMKASHGSRTWPRRRCNSSDVFYATTREDEDETDDSQAPEDSFCFEPKAGLRHRRAVGRISPIRLFHSRPPMPRRNHPYSRPRSRWVIPADHPFRVVWDIITFILSVAYVYATHGAIRDRKFGTNPFLAFCDAWFLMDILLNFVTERKTSKGEILRDYRSICARYLTSWFAVDALSLFPWESLYVQPIIELQNRRSFFQKSFFRSRAVLRVTRHLRGKHFRWFGRVAKHTKQHGVGASRLLRLIIKYIPKYLLFFRNMKGAVAVRLLRQVHWCRRFYRNFRMLDEKDEGATSSMTRDDMDFMEDDFSSSMSFGDSRRVQVVGLEDWEYVDDDVPL